ncbi:MAG: bacteriophage abortive infection AbiH family protein [Clostridiales bacterium]|nr:MAG: bacteriophage abortive infection AbiH family protein [Clostridiales bacterium]
MRALETKFSQLSCLMLLKSWIINNSSVNWEKGTKVSMSSLFILGNGFDIAHGIKTQYSEFRKFVLSLYPEALDLRDEIVYLEDFGKI